MHLLLLICINYLFYHKIVWWHSSYFLISKLVPLDGAEKLDDKTLWYLMQMLLLSFTWNLEPLSVVVPLIYFQYLLDLILRFIIQPPPIYVLHQLQNKLNCIQQYLPLEKSNLKLLPLLKYITTSRNTWRKCCCCSV
jgi:hypothetical protein